MDKLYVGTITAVVDIPHSHPPLTKDEEAEVAAAFIERFQQVLASQVYPFGFDFELVSSRRGCIKLKFMVYLTAAVVAAGTAFDYISKYKDFRESVPALISDASNGFKCYVRDDEIACKAFLQTNQLSTRLYVVVEGDSLSKIVLDKWQVPRAQSKQVMYAVLKHYPQAFMNGDINKLRVGAKISLPTEEMKKGVPGGSR
ncbi:FimV family protein [Variovorax sp. MHTC-1]|uniref:type IV pilus assembly protein FimV n=1 Tax=Variovorax sp. MHTC-1 TaxID=2495593 RepID=UPI000F8870B7|nr:hypothetical protein [Variovorax sp. MHTC-1]RST52660.1 hypothetical protein EJI01_15755 [Variovorax sp. MHTC-1]